MRFKHSLTFNVDIYVILIFCRSKFRPPPAVAGFIA